MIELALFYQRLPTMGADRDDDGLWSRFPSLWRLIIFVIALTLSFQMTTVVISPDMPLDPSRTPRKLSASDPIPGTCNAMAKTELGGAIVKYVSSVRVPSQARALRSLDEIVLREHNFAQRIIPALQTPCVAVRGIGRTCELIGFVSTQGATNLVDHAADCCGQCKRCAPVTGVSLSGR